MLKYIGNGFLAGVPARDLTEEETERYGGKKALVGSGLYEEIHAQPKRKAVQRGSVMEEDQDGEGEANNENEGGRK
jgi:hypothetical protein